MVNGLLNLSIDYEKAYIYMVCVRQDCINVQVAKNANTSTVRGITLCALITTVR